jgi:hypothetical protein
VRPSKIIDPVKSGVIDSQQSLQEQFVPFRKAICLTESLLIREVTDLSVWVHFQLGPHTEVRAQKLIDAPMVRPACLCCKEDMEIVGYGNGLHS